jgi:3-methyladenine DNA glycosylase AlkD
MCQSSERLQPNVIKTTLSEIADLLQDQYHEVRLTVLFMLVYRYQKAKTGSIQKELVGFYLHHTEFINNWNLIDTSCRHILRNYYLEKEKQIIYELARTGRLWE